jgi:hypothetical protein
VGWSGQLLGLRSEQRRERCAYSHFHEIPPPHCIPSSREARIQATERFIETAAFLHLPMSALGQKRTSRHIHAMSTLLPIADISVIMSRHDSFQNCSVRMPPQVFFAPPSARPSIPEFS